MQAIFDCPFCKGRIFVNGNLTVCPVCGFKSDGKLVDWNVTSAVYLKQSATAMNLIKQAQPVYVFAKNQLFEPCFRAESIKMYHTLGSIKPKDIEGLQFIYYDGVYAKILQVYLQSGRKGFFVPATFGETMKQSSVAQLFDTYIALSQNTGRAKDKYEDMALGSFLCSSTALDFAYNYMTKNYIAPESVNPSYLLYSYMMFGAMKMFQSWDYDEAMYTIQDFLRTISSFVNKDNLNKRIPDGKEDLFKTYLYAVPDFGLMNGFVYDAGDYINWSLCDRAAIVRHDKEFTNEELTEMSAASDVFELMWYSYGLPAMRASLSYTDFVTGLKDCSRKDYVLAFWEKVRDKVS